MNSLHLVGRKTGYDQSCTLGRLIWREVWNVLDLEILQLSQLEKAVTAVQVRDRMAQGGVPIAAQQVENLAECL